MTLLKEREVSRESGSALSAATAAATTAFGLVAGTALKNMPFKSPALHFHMPLTTHARVLHQIRTLESPTRGILRETLEMSQPSVTRHVRALMDAGLVEEREVEHDGERAGRPHSILGLNGRHVVTWGAHIGAHTTVLTVTDGAGRLIREREIALPVAAMRASAALDEVARQLKELGAGLPTPVSVGVAVSAHLDRLGIVASQEYGWDGVDVAAEISERVEQHVFVGAGAAAMAAQELLSTPLSSGESGSTLYFYAREVVNHAWIVNGAVHRPHSGQATSAFHRLAAGTELAAGEAHPFSGSAAVAAARRAGIEVRNYRHLVEVAASNKKARALIDARNSLLADAIGLVLDVIDPESLVLAGEAFTADRVGLKDIVRMIRDRRGGPDQLKVNLAGPAVTRDAARLTALYPLWCDPII